MTPNWSASVSDGSTKTTLCEKSYLPQASKESINPERGVEMKNRSIIIITAISALIIGLFLRQTEGQGPPARRLARPTRVAVCDVQLILRECKAYKQVDAEFFAKAQSFAAEDKKRLEKIRQLREILQNLNPNSRQYEEKLAELDRLTIERAVQAKLQEKAARRRSRRQTEKIFQQILTVVAEIAKKRGYDIVISRESVEISSSSAAELFDKIALRKCLYYTPEVDLTNEVLQKVNLLYEQSHKH